MIWIILITVVVAAACDLRRREIPDWLPLLLLGLSLCATAFHLHDIGWLAMCGGLAIGFVISAIFFALGGLGGGDVKLIAALGAALGPVALLQSLFWVAVTGGVLAIIAALRKKRDFAYGPAIALGVFIHLICTGVLTDAAIR